MFKKIIITALLAACLTMSCVSCNNGTEVGEGGSQPLTRQPQTTATTTAPESVEAIFAIENKGDMLNSLYNRVSFNCSSGDNMDALSDVEKTFYYGYTFEYIVNTGGIERFYYEKYGNDVTSVRQALETVGCDYLIQQLDTSYTAFPNGTIPSDMSERRKVMENDMNIMDEKNEILFGIDTAHYQLTQTPEDFETQVLNYFYDYATENRAEFH